MLVSEVMLQQTQVERVRPRWHSFLARFPTPAACADSPLGDVLVEWAGLGYPRRARDLHRCATRVVAEHSGSLPDDLGALMALPGIGPYTARAVLAFAFEADVGVVDTNVGRVLARTHGRRLAAREAQHLADSVVPAGGGWAWNQAMLDLGATVCRPRSPVCQACPVSRWCAWAVAGHPAPDPATGSAGVSTRQARFEGSDRQGRGRLLAAVAAGPVPAGSVASAMGWPHDTERAARVAATLVADGLVVLEPAGHFDGTPRYRLP